MVDKDSFFWFHSIDLGNGEVTNGLKSLEIHQKEADAFFGPVDLRGKTFLDIGAWNGVYSFEAKRRGASLVVASDAPTWMDPKAQGHAAFSYARERLGLDIKDVVVSIENMTPADMGGQFDVVLFSGVFYHMPDPLIGLSNAARMTKETLIVETHLDLMNLGVPAMRYYIGDELDGDSSNYWGPNRLLIEALLREEGFKEVHFCDPVHPCRGIFHAYR
ncbi:hypothetical protein BH10PSE13_BH10PSE13_07490 [soil metagenome]